MNAEGKWWLSVKTPMGLQVDQLELRTVDGKLLGDQAGPMLGSHQDLPISVDGDGLSWSVAVTKPMKMTLKFSATVRGDQMEGKVKPGLFPAAPFTGQRGVAPPPKVEKRTEPMTPYEKLRQQRLAKLDDQYRGMIEGQPPLRTIGVEGLREVLQGVMSSKEKAPGVEIRDIEVPGPRGPVPTRIYTPENYSGPKLGVYVHTHAGGFVAGGGLATWDWMNTMVAAKVPCVVVAPDFRLPPENRFPVGLEDCWAVINWVANQGAAQGWDGGKIAVGGGCTGGNFAAVLSLMARDAGGPKISLQILQSFVADARATSASHQEFREGYGLRHDDNNFVIENYVTDKSQVNDWRVSPVLADSVAGVAPALITVGEYDILRDEDVAYGERLKQVGVKAEIHVLPQEGHAPNPRTADDLWALQIGRLAETIGPGAK